MKKSEKTKSQIKDAALGLFSVKGFSAVKVGDIADKLGISRGCIYRYYSGTDQLFEEIVNGFFSELESSFKKLLSSGASYTECLCRIIDSFIKEIPDNSSSAVMAMAEYCKISGNTYMQDAFRSARKVWSDFIRGGIDAGEFNIVNPDGAAELVIISYLGARMCVQAVNISKDTATRTMLALKDYLLKERKD